MLHRFGRNPAIWMFGIFLFSLLLWTFQGNFPSQRQGGATLIENSDLVAQTEWVCEDPNYPINCNNGTCCESGSGCCHLHCCYHGSLCCPTGCCPAGYPWFCPENNRCYERYDDASIKCPSILQQCS